MHDYVNIVLALFNETAVLERIDILSQTLYIAIMYIYCLIYKSKK